MLQRWSIPLMAAALAAPGCKKDEAPVEVEGSAAPAVAEVEPAGAKRPEEGPAEDPKAAPSPADGSTPTNAAAPERRVPLAPAARKPLIGHFRLASLERLVDKTRTQLVPAPLAMMVTTDGLRSLLEDDEDESGRGLAQVRSVILLLLVDGRGPGHRQQPLERSGSDSLVRR